LKKTEKIREYRILAIDDEQDAVDLLELILFRENYIVEKACTANEAFKLLNNEK
jgi:PleD family two-component response regulator